MAHGFKMCDRDQPFLLPHDVREWLPENHLAWFIIDAVSQFDLSSFVDRYRLRPDGRGREAYDPEMMVALLVYAYCTGVRSSRVIECRCALDVAYRVIAANHAPDHATIARFRANHEEALARLFTQVLSMCQEAGMVRVGTVALDGTRMGADASKQANRTADAIDKEVAKILAEAQATDQAEDEKFGPDARGDELPPGLERRAERVERLKRAKERLDREETVRREAAERQLLEREARKAEAEAAGGKEPGRPPQAPKPEDPAQPESKAPTANTTDPDSRLLKTKDGYQQGYNAQAMVGEGQIVIAAELTQEANDVGQLERMIMAAQDELAAAGVTQDIGTLLADAGYFSEANAALDLGPDLLIATAAGRNVGKLEATGELPAKPAPPQDPPLDRESYLHEEGARRADIMRRWLACELSAAAVVALLGITDESRAYELRRAFLRFGEAGVRPRQMPRALKTTWKEWMTARLGTPEGKAAYAKRSQMIEPVFGQHKQARGMRRFSRRGYGACASEWKLMNACNNLLKLAVAKGRCGRPRPRSPLNSPPERAKSGPGHHHRFRPRACLRSCSAA